MTIFDQQHSQALAEIIHQEIQHQPDQLISFADYMSLALYHPDYGYYCSPSIQIGRQGDFTTAPEISSLFGSCLARQLTEIMRASDLDCVYELGAGNGKLALDILTALAADGCLPRHYYIYEISLSLRAKQKTYLQTHCPQWLDRIVWLEQLPVSYEGIVIANEVLDALPVHRFMIEENQSVSERCVGMEDGHLVWRNSASKTPALIEAATLLRDEYELSPGYCSEVALTLHDFLHSLIQPLTRGVILFFDYGYGRTEYYHPQRREGSLTCFYQHQRHDNPLVMPGLQDITAHVDFTRVIGIADELGCDLIGYTTQSSFLFACGLMDLASELEKQKTIIEQFALHQAIKVLTLPTEMGERIKVMGLSKNMDINAMGFNLQDRCRDL